MTILVNVPLIKTNTYFTDGKRLYRIVAVHDKNETVNVENCETLFKHTIALETVYQGWTEVKI